SSVTRRLKRHIAAAMTLVKLRQPAPRDLATGNKIRRYARPGRAPRMRNSSSAITLYASEGQLDQLRPGGIAQPRRRRARRLGRAFARTPASLATFCAILPLLRSKSGC